MIHMRQKCHWTFKYEKELLSAAAASGISYRNKQQENRIKAVKTLQVLKLFPSSTWAVGFSILTR